MKIKIEIDCKNAAFADDNPGELKRVLHQAALKAASMVEPPCRSGTRELRDINGNTVGWVRVIS